MAVAMAAVRRDLMTRGLSLKGCGAPWPTRSSAPVGAATAGSMCFGHTVCVVVSTLTMVGVAVAGCAPPVIPPESASLGVESAPMPSATPELSEWIEFRRAFGLRHDSAWVLEVASRPSSINETGIPLTSEELAALGRAVRSTGPLVDFVTRYGERFPDSFGGVRAEGRSVILQMRDNVDIHRAYLHRVILDPSLVEVRQVSWSIAELKGFAGTVAAAHDWFGMIGAELVAADPSSRNVVRVRVRAPSEDVETVVLAHFGSPAWMEVEWDGPLAWTGARGTLVVTAVDESDAPVSGLICSWEPLNPAINSEDAMGFVTTDQGECRNAFVPAGTYDVFLSRGDLVLGTGRVTVPPNDVGVIRIVTTE